MRSRKLLRTVDVPQADSLPLVRAVVDAVRTGHVTVPMIVKATAFSDRHVRYRLQTARILGLVSSRMTLTRSGVRLVRTVPGSSSERMVLKSAINNCDAIRLIAPDLLSATTVDVHQVARSIARNADLSEATSRRRAGTLCSWARQLRSSSRRE